MTYLAAASATDLQTAADWYRKAAEQGDLLAAFNLGRMYHHGEGVTRDDAQAVRWYRQAAARGDAFALNNLGFMVYNGLGVSADVAKAYALFTLAMQRGNSNAEQALKLLQPQLGNEERMRGEVLVKEWEAALKAGRVPAW
jgi:TPR repeat protein